MEPSVWSNPGRAPAENSAAAAPVHPPSKLYLYSSLLKHIQCILFETKLKTGIH